MTDTERQQAADELREHFTGGRLDVDEFSSRLGEVWASENRADLATALRQLPRLPGRPRPGDPPPPVPGAWPGPPPAWDGHRHGLAAWPMWLKVLALVVVVMALGSLWPLWLLVLVGWLVFVRPRRYRRWWYEA